jgi:phosphate transport system protein
MDDIEGKVIELFAMIAEDLPAATHALLGGGAEAVTALAEREQVIDALYVEVEQLAGREILLQAPVGSDLRFLLTVLRIVPELERSHDLVMDIAGRAGRFRDADLSAGSRELARRMADLASGMWRQAVDAWYSRDRTAVTAMGESNRQMGELHASMTAEIALGRMPVRATMEMTLAARDYERLGAHAVNIARRVAYLAGRRG